MATQKETRVKIVEFEDLSIDLTAKIEAIFVSLSSSRAEPHVETMALIGLDLASKLGCVQDEFIKVIKEDAA